MDSLIFERAKIKDSLEISHLVGKLLNEIMSKIGINVFNFSLEETDVRLKDFIENEKNYIFIAKIENKIIGFISAYEGYALYTQGAFGTISELYVEPEYRSKGIGKELIVKLKELAIHRKWSRFEVTTPPLPEFEKTLNFYEEDGFSITGGRKLKKEIF